MFERPTFKVNPGDTIVVKAQGLTIEAEVLTANWWSDGGWYIEMIDIGNPHLYRYWKQRYDGGQLVKVNGEQVV